MASARLGRTRPAVAPRRARRRVVPHRHRRPPVQRCAGDRYQDLTLTSLTPDRHWIGSVPRPQACSTSARSPLGGHEIAQNGSFRIASGAKVSRPVAARPIRPMRTGLNPSAPRAGRRRARRGSARPQGATFAPAADDGRRSSATTPTATSSSTRPHVAMVEPSGIGHDNVTDIVVAAQAGARARSRPGTHQGRRRQAAP